MLSVHSVRCLPVILWPLAPTHHLSVVPSKDKEEGMLGGRGWWPEGWQKASVGSLGIQVRISKCQHLEVALYPIGEGKSYKLLKGTVQYLIYILRSSFWPQWRTDCIEAVTKEVRLLRKLLYKPYKRARILFLRFFNQWVMQEYYMTISPAAWQCLAHKRNVDNNRWMKHTYYATDDSFELQFFALPCI